MKRTDEELMAALALVDMEALQVLYRRHSKLVYRVSLKFIGHREDALDLTQALFTDLVTLAPKYRSEGEVTTWLYRVTMNRCLNWAKSAGRRRRAPLKEEDLERGWARLQDLGAGEPWGGGGEPHQALERKQRWEAMERAFSELPPRQKLALTLKAFEGLSYHEIATAMETSRSSVESLLVRARRKLSEALER